MKVTLSPDDISKIKRLNFLRINDSNYKGLLTFGVLFLVLGALIPYTGWKEAPNPPKNFNDYVTRIIPSTILSFFLLLIWLFNWLLKQIEIWNGFKTVRDQVVSRKIVIGYFKLLFFENGQIVFYRGSSNLSKLKVDDRVSSEWTCLNRLIRYEILETIPLVATKPEQGILKYPFGLVASWQTMVVTVIPFGLGVLLLANLKAIIALVVVIALVSPFIIAWTTLFGFEINLKSKCFNEYQIILGMKKNVIKRFSEINEVNLTYKRERKMSYHPYNYGPYYIDWYDVNIKYDQVRSINIVTSEDREDSANRAMQIAIDLGVEFNDRSAKTINV